MHHCRPHFAQIWWLRGFLKKASEASKLPPNSTNRCRCSPSLRETAEDETARASDEVCRAARGGLRPHVEGQLNLSVSLRNLRRNPSEMNIGRPEEPNGGRPKKTRTIGEPTMNLWDSQGGHHTFSQRKDRSRLAEAQVITVLEAPFGSNTFAKDRLKLEFASFWSPSSK